MRERGREIEREYEGKKQTQFPNQEINLSVKTKLRALRQALKLLPIYQNCQMSPGRLPPTIKAVLRHVRRTLLQIEGPFLTANLQVTLIRL